MKYVLVFKNPTKMPEGPKLDSDKFEVLQTQVSWLTLVIENSYSQRAFIDNEAGLWDSIQWVKRELGWLMMNTGAFEWPTNRKIYRDLLLSELIHLDTLAGNYGDLLDTLENMVTVRDNFDLIAPNVKYKLSQVLLALYGGNNHILSYEGGPFSPKIKTYYEKIVIQQILPMFGAMGSEIGYTCEAIAYWTNSGFLPDNIHETLMAMFQGLLDAYGVFRDNLTEVDQNLFTSIVVQGHETLMQANLQLDSLDTINSLLKACDVITRDVFVEHKDQVFLIYENALTKAKILDKSGAEGIAAAENYFSGPIDTINSFLAKIVPVACASDALTDGTLFKIIQNLIAHYSNTDSNISCLIETIVITFTRVIAKRLKGSRDAKTTFVDFEKPDSVDDPDYDVHEQFYKIANALFFGHKDLLDQ